MNTTRFNLDNLCVIDKPTMDGLELKHYNDAIRLVMDDGYESVDIDELFIDVNGTLQLVINEGEYMFNLESGDSIQDCQEELKAYNEVLGMLGRLSDVEPMEVQSLYYQYEYITSPDIVDSESGWIEKRISKYLNDGYDYQRVMSFLSGIIGYSSDIYFRLDDYANLQPISTNDIECWLYDFKVEVEKRISIFYRHILIN